MLTPKTQQKSALRPEGLSGRRILLQPLFLGQNPTLLQKRALWLSNRPRELPSIFIISDS
jgi:hypothetical protein